MIRVALALAAAIWVAVVVAWIAIVTQPPL